MKTLTLLAVLGAALYATTDAHATLICTPVSPEETYLCEETEPTFDGIYQWVINQSDGQLAWGGLPNVMVFQCNPTQGGYVTIAVEMTNFGFPDQPRRHEAVVICREPLPPPPVDVSECIMNPDGTCRLAYCTARGDSSPASRFRGMRGTRSGKGESSTRRFVGRSLGGESGGSGGFGRGFDYGDDGRGMDFGTVYGMDLGGYTVRERRRCG